MKIYFSGSIRGGRIDADLYRDLITELKKYGQVLTEHVGSSALKEELSDREIHDRDIQWLHEADIVIAEVTTPSLGVGYEIAKAISFEKPVYCLYRENEETRVSAMIKGSPKVTCHSYNKFPEAREILCHIFGIRTRQ
ncbi:nucleoside 2-deoxyribosyltransferase [Balneolaceae bacterium YR4-1]|uniref:Putative 2'-deoxynucleoside 5'-phosphate N-hydrolase 1 n=1 Tax=Halalkalibaculum roseum TaxID=2709311 RepID=A0A6M1SVG4_9BACT|nr:nucleoside 2-deoxyribosyltransferase [Halalkalibaculum roseum]NGP76116.1 nucleoside 2-deoxyribosyltransferase [Halalkalibaculum roseum]